MRKDKILSGVCPFCVERRGILYGTMDPVKSPGNKGTCHEYVIFTGKRSFNPRYRRWCEPEPGVICGMPNYDHNPVPQSAGTPADLLL